jgi:hypothetical protein
MPAGLIELTPDQGVAEWSKGKWAHTRQDLGLSQCHVELAGAPTYGGHPYPSLVGLAEDTSARLYKIFPPIS